MPKIPDRPRFATLRVAEGVTDVMVDCELGAIWETIFQEPDLRAAALEAGLGAADLASPRTSPFHAAPDAGDFGVAETILISVASGIATETLKRLWDKLIWPRLERKFGTGLARGADGREGG